MSEYNKELSLQQEIKEMLKEQESSKTVKIETSNPTSLENKTIVDEVKTDGAQSTEVYSPKDEWEEKALKLGWSPDHKGENFVDAREYVLRKPLFERIERQSKELREIKERQKQHDSHLMQVRKEAYEQAFKDLETRREVAVSEANMEEFRRLDHQTKQLNIKMQQDPIVNRPIQPELDPEIESFYKKNTWFSSPMTIEDAKMKAAAESVDNYLAKQAHIEGKTINVREHLSNIEGELKRLFPHRFESTRATTTNPTQMVGKSTTPTTRLSTANLADKLTPAQKELGLRFQRDNKEFTLEVYAAELDKMGRLGK